MFWNYLNNKPILNASVRSVIKKILLKSVPPIWQAGAFLVSYFVADNLIVFMNSQKKQKSKVKFTNEN